jgi:hypothetical protein
MRSSATHTLLRFGRAANTGTNAMQSVARGRQFKPFKANDWSLSAQAHPHFAVGSEGLTQQALAALFGSTSSCAPGTAQSALPNCELGAAATEYGSPCQLLRTPARSRPGRWSLGRPQRGAGSARRVFGIATPSGLPSVRPNPSLKLTRYGKLCKPGPRQSYYRRGPGLQSSPPRAA